MYEELEVESLLLERIQLKKRIKQIELRIKELGYTEYL